MDRFLTQLSYSKFFAFCLMAIVTWIVYYNSITVPFYLDDIRSIANNTVIHSGSITDIYNTFGLRFFAYLSFWADYQIVGSTSSTEAILTQLHISNITIHMLNGFVIFTLVYLLCNKTPNSPALLGNKITGQVSEQPLSSNKVNIVLPLVVTLLFLVHPLHSQAVTYIVQRTAALVSLFYLTSLLSYLWFRLSSVTWHKPIALVLTMFFAGLALFTKQNSVTLPIILILIELIFFNSIKLKHIFIAFFAAVTALALSYFAMPEKLTALLISLDRLTRENEMFSRFDYFIAQLNILWVYLGKFFIPYPMRLEYPYQINSFPLWQSTLAGLSHVGLIIFAWLQRKKIPLVTFGILFYYTTHIIESGLIPIKDLAFEHRNYLPDVGLLIIIAGVATYANAQRKLLKTYQSLVLITVVIFIFALLTSKRNSQWQDPITFYQYELSHFPDSCRLLNNLANEYHNRGQLKPAMELVGECIKVNGGKLTQPEMINNYVAILVSNKEFVKADSVATDALTFVNEPISRRRILENLGISKLSQKQLPLAEKYLSMAVELPNPYPKTYFALSVALAQQGKFALAKHYVEIGLVLEPSNQRGKVILQRLNKLL